MRGRLIATTVSLLAHASVAAAFVAEWPQREPPGAIDQGLQGIEVMLSAGGAPGADAAPPPEPPPPEPEPEKPQVVEQPVEPPPPPEPEPELITSKDVAPDIAEAPKPEPKPKPVVQKPKPPPKPVVQAPPKPAPEPVQQPPVEETKVAVAPIPPSPGQSGHRAAPGAGSGTATTSGGNPGAEADYYARLLAWLEEKKDYPSRAQMRRMQGVAYLRFVIDADGKVMRYSVERSSGHRLLDDAVEKMIEKANPLPAIPAELGKTSLDLVVPVQFLLK